MSDEVNKLKKLGDYEFDSGNFESSYDYYKKIVELDPDDAYAWYRRSICAMRDMNVKEFIAGINKARTLASNNLTERIESDYFEEMTKFYRGAIDNILSISKEGRGLDHQAAMFEHTKDAVNYTENILDLSNELKAKVKVGILSVEAGISMADKLYKAAYNILEVDVATFGSAGIVWQNGIGLSLVPRLNNLAAWMNYQISRSSKTSTKAKIGINAKFV